MDMYVLHIQCGELLKHNTSWLTTIPEALAPNTFRQIHSHNVIAAMSSGEARSYSLPHVKSTPSLFENFKNYTRLPSLRP